MSGNPFITQQNQKFLSETRPTKTQIETYKTEVNNRAVKYLEGLITYSHLKLKDVERELGYGKSYLTKLFDYKIELKVNHVTEICYLLEFPICLFWRIVYEEETINYHEFDNSLVRRVEGLLIYIYGKEPEKLAKALGYVVPVHRKGDI